MRKEPSLFGVLCFVLTCMISTTRAYADDCNIADLLFGKVRIELIQHHKPGFAGYETGVIFGNDFDSKRFYYERILGRIASPERDGSRLIRDVTGNFCGVIQKDMRLDYPNGNCATCDKDASVGLRKMAPSSYAVIQNKKVVGTVEGRLPDIIRRSQ